MHYGYMTGQEMDRFNSCKDAVFKEVQKRGGT
jgi:hypothetical protein